MRSGFERDLAALRAWANQQGSGGRTASVGATATLPATLDLTDDQAFALAAERGGIAEMAFDPNYMLHVEVDLPHPLAPWEILDVRWPGVPDALCARIGAVSLRELQTPIRVTARRGLSADIDNQGRVFRPLVRGEAQAFLIAAQRADAKAWVPGHSAELYVPGRGGDFEREVMVAISAGIQRWVWPASLDGVRVTGQ